MVSDLYDLTITAIVMTDNVGFGAANNVAIGHAASDAIYIVNPDVYPMRDQAGVLRQTLEAGDLGDRLTGGLLFYDDANLMHSGMFLERDLFFRSRALAAAEDAATPIGLLRVEHFDKGVPFVAADWTRPVVVPAITGAVMAFDRRSFERIGGFSTRYIYGHYEDADLSLRWARENGPVVIDPRLRLIHLEGQGSRARGEQYRSAAIVNRFFFTQQHGADFDAQPDAYRRRHGLVPA
jgi:GT2 family glycosyltransferase